jgi:purine-binding chemotaxis protein CheW
MNGSTQLVVFTLDGRRHALPLSVVERVVAMVDIEPLPRAPVNVSGVINVGGRIVPVFDIRQRFRLPERIAELGDKLVLAKTKQREVALVVDEVDGVNDAPIGNTTPAEDVLPNLSHLTGVVRRADGLIFIHDLDAFLSLEESDQLNQAARQEI